MPFSHLRAALYPRVDKDYNIAPRLSQLARISLVSDSNYLVLDQVHLVPSQIHPYSR